MDKLTTDNAMRAIHEALKNNKVCKADRSRVEREIEKYLKFEARKIHSVDDLIESIRNAHYDYTIYLNGGMKSCKQITINSDKKFRVINHIDNSKQFLTRRQLASKKYTNIGEAIIKGCLIREN